MSRVYVDHAHRHLPGGTDPIPFFPQSFDSYRDTILATPALWAYWPLSDSGGLDFEELVAGRNLVGVESAPYLFSYGLAGPIVDDDATSVGFAGKDSGTSTMDGTSAAYTFVSGDNADLVLGGASTFTVEVWLYLNTPVVLNQFGETTYLGTVFSVGDASFSNAALNVFVDAGGALKLLRGTSGEVAASTSPVVNGWNHVAVTSDGTTITLYLNGLAAATVAAGSRTVTAGYRFQLGRQTYSGTFSQYLEGRLAHAAIYTEPLDAATVAAHAAHTAGLDTTGWVPTSDGHGGVSLQPPGVEVTHGDGDPVEAPATRPPSLSGPTNGSGWHLNAHVETAVLYDSSPARFDVPPRAWTRVPFNAVRIQRQWETTVDGPIVSAWLEDDRDLSGQAGNGLLHVSAEMGSPQAVAGWFTIEYPVLDFTGLPDSTPGGDPDAYARAARIVDASTGQVLRAAPGSSNRVFFEWLFRDFAADGLVGAASYPADNPYPLYPAWADRPMVKPGPYPQIDPASSLVYYKRDAFYGGFSHEYYVGANATLAAGTNLCLQAWQDTPWPLRFSTDHFPNYTPLPYPELWKQRPYLAVSYSYDPDSVDHSTGRLL